MAARLFRLHVNGATRDVEPPIGDLLDVLRTDLGLTGTKTNCLDAECGVCTVLIDGRALNACLVPRCGGPGPRDHDDRGAGAPARSTRSRGFIEFGAVQCGYCIPGMILSAKAYLDESPRPTERGIREALSGNLCRCTGYQKIVDAVLGRGSPRRHVVAP